MNDYDMSVLYHHDKANIVEDDLSRMTMGSVSHLDNAKMYIASEVHSLDRLGARLKSYPDGGAIVLHKSKTFLVVEVKSKQHLDLDLMEFKESVLRKLNGSFSLGWGMLYKGTKRDCVFSM